MSARGIRPVPPSVVSRSLRNEFTFRARNIWNELAQPARSSHPPILVCCFLDREVTDRPIDFMFFPVFALELHCSCIFCFVCSQILSARYEGIFQTVLQGGNQLYDTDMVNSLLMFYVR